MNERALEKNTVRLTRKNNTNKLKRIIAKNDDVDVHAGAESVCVSLSEDATFRRF